MFVTNNSTLSRANYVKKFQKLGIEATEKDIFSSAFATAVYLRNILDFPKDKRVYVIGESGIVDELKAVGIESTGASVSELGHPCFFWGRWTRDRLRLRDLQYPLSRTFFG